MVRKRRKKRVKVEKPKASKSASNNKNDHGVSTEELEASRKLKQDKIDAQLVHVYNLDSIQQVRDMRIEADGYGVKLETIYLQGGIKRNEESVGVSKHLTVLGHGMTHVKKFKKLSENILIIV